MLLIEPRRTPRPPEAGMCHATKTLGSSPDTTQRRLGNILNDRAYAYWRGTGARRPQEADGRRPRGPGRRLRATITGRGVRHEPGGESLSPGGSEPPPAPGQRGGQRWGERTLQLKEEGARGEVQSSGSAGRLRVSIGDKQEGATCGGCRTTVARGQRVVGLPVWTRACYPCMVRGKCNQERCGADTASLQR